jgi:hypothetical protein
VTAPERHVLSNAEADYLLAAVVGMTQGLRLVPVAELAEHFEQRYRDACGRGDRAEKRLVLDELTAASTAQALVRDVESLMDGRRNAALAERQALDTLQQAGAMSDAARAAVETPPSRRPLADDDVWVNAPRPPAR